MMRGRGVGLLIGLAMALNLGAAEMPLEEAAKQVGKEVTFTAEVKGVSESPNSKTLYVNFGDAYPRQTLSLRFAPENRDITKSLPRLLGRTVTVTGVVESTKFGPVLPVSNREQITVQPLDTEGVLDAEGEGGILRQRVSLALEKLFLAGDYAALEEIAQKWAREKSRFGDGGWKLLLFFDALDPDDEAPESEWLARRDRLENWRKKFPNSPVPVIALGDWWTGYAWEARGGGWASTVTDEGWKLFRERLKKAREVLESSPEPGIFLPAWTCEMLTVALGQGWDKAETRKLLDKAIAAEPEYYAVYFNYTYYLLPRWYGDRGEWEDFAAEMEQAHPGKLGAELYARTVWSKARFYNNIFQESTVSWLRMKGGFEAMRERWPNSLWLLNAFAYYAAMARDAKTALPLLNEIGDRADMNLWVSWENVDLTRRWLEDESGSAPTPYIFRANN